MELPEGISKVVIRAEADDELQVSADGERIHLGIDGSSVALDQSGLEALAWVLDAMKEWVAN